MDSTNSAMAAQQNGRRPGESTYGGSVMAAHAIADEDSLRAAVYSLLASLLSSSPDLEKLNELAALEGGEGDMGEAIALLAKMAAQTTPDTLDQEFHDLFIGLGRGELVPYGSYYLTGFLNEKPLARLRNTMGKLGIERDPDVKEPEDHIAAVNDIMAGLIMGVFGDPENPDEERAFFDAHVEPWAGHFFRDLEGARNSTFYAAVGRVGSVFMDIEKQAFSME